MVRVGIFMRITSLGRRSLYCQPQTTRSASGRCRFCSMLYVNCLCKCHYIGSDRLELKNVSPVKVKDAVQDFLAEARKYSPAVVSSRPLSHAWQTGQRTSKKALLSFPHDSPELLSKYFGVVPTRTRRHGHHRPA
jgi:hypothetical protein